MDTKTRPRIHAVYKRPTSDLPTTRDKYKLKVKGWRRIFHANGNQRKARKAILISDKIYFFFFFKIDFIIRNITIDKKDST